MTPGQFLREIGKKPPAPVYFFLGPEAYQRGRCRKALVERVLPPAEHESGFVRHDLEESSLAAVINEAMSFSLFAPRRVIWVSSAEAALPRILRSSSSDDEEKQGPEAPLLHYLKNPSPDVVLVFECSRYGFEGDDKSKIDRVRKFYGAIGDIVEFPRCSPEEAQQIARELAGAAGLKLGAAEIEMLVEAVNADAARVAVEIEKLRLWAGEAGTINVDDIATLVPNARATTVFALVGAVGRGDRMSALDALDALIREGEYLPLVLTFLGTQFRLALVAREANLRTPPQIQTHFSKLGIPMWRARAEQVAQTATSFSLDRLEQVIRRIYDTDKALRDARPDDRVVMEDFVLDVTK